MILRSLPDAIKATSTGTIWVFISTTDAAASDASVEEELWGSVLPLPEDVGLVSLEPFVLEC